MKKKPTIILSRSDVQTLLTLEECINAVEGAFKLYGEGKASPPGILGIHAANGGFHTKAGLLNLGRNYFVAKTNANFPDNRKKYNLPTIQGVVVVADAEKGCLLALMDSIQLTIIRTGAATAVAAKYLSNLNAKTLTICGCGEQGRISLQMLLKVRSIQKVFAFDIDPSVSRKFAEEFNFPGFLTVESVNDLAVAVKSSDICVTCTTSHKPFIKKEFVSPGTFIAAVGADNEEKQEIESVLVASSKVVTDLTNQCAAGGELFHAISENLMTRENVAAELGEVVAGTKTVRTSESDIIIFDSTGMALQDVASAAIVYEKALKEKIGLFYNFN